MRSLTLVLASSLVIQSAAAQSVQMPIGIRVRATDFVPKSRPVIGILSAADSNELVILTEGDFLQIQLQRQRIKSLEVSNGQQSIVGRSLLVGTLAGVAVGAAFTGSHRSVCSPDINIFCSEYRRGINQAAPMFFGLAGGIVGIVYGKSHPAEQWVEWDHARGAAR